MHLRIGTKSSSLGDGNTLKAVLTDLWQSEHQVSGRKLTLRVLQEKEPDQSR
jgi:hypothetical protein